MIVNVLSVGASLVSLSLLHLLSFYASGLKSEVAILINLHVRLPLTSGRPHLKPHSLPLNQARETGDKGGGGRTKVLLKSERRRNGGTEMEVLKEKEEGDNNWGTKKSKKGRDKE